jgi:hypothetical protein
MPDSFRPYCESFTNGVSAEIDKMPERFARAELAIGAAFTTVSQGVIAAGEAIGSALSAAVDKIVTFVSNNWENLIKYTLAWGVIIACTGFLYGFEDVSLPLTIGMAGGAGLGILVGIASVNSYDPEGKYTLWNILNNGIKSLDENGTRQIILSVAVTVLLAASVVFPYVMGSLFGLLIALQITVKTCTNQNLGRDPKKIISAHAKLQEEFTKLGTQFTAFKERMDALSEAIKSVEPKGENK